MLHRIVLASMVVVGLGLAGCQKQTAVPESPTDVPQTEVTAKEETLASPSSELNAYNEKLAKILLARDEAEAKWQVDLRSVATKIDEQGLSALAPVYAKYAKAQDEAVSALEKLSPPAEVVKVQQALISTFKALGDNLDATVGAMHSDGQEDLVRLGEARKKIQAEGATDVNGAVTLAKFDLKIFQTKRMLVPAPDAL